MSDPLNDPRFPHRPDHPDFWRLSEAILRADADATEFGFLKAIDGVVDEVSLMYAAEQRVHMLLTTFADGRLGDSVRDVMVSLYFDAFLTGYRFHEAGGSRDPAP